MAAELVGNNLHGPSDFDFSLLLGPQLHERVTVMEAGNDAGASSTHFLCPSPAEGNDVPEPADDGLVEEDSFFDTESFIEAIRNERCLWDTSCLSYRDRNKKANAWEKLGRQCNKNGRLKHHVCFVVYNRPSPPT